MDDHWVVVMRVVTTVAFSVLGLYALALIILHGHLGSLSSGPQVVLVSRTSASTSVTAQISVTPKASPSRSPAASQEVSLIPQQVWLFPLPANVPPDHHWRYQSQDLYWNKNDALYRKFKEHSAGLSLPPPSVKTEISRVCSVLRSKGREKLCAMFEQCYPNTLATTTRFLDDGTTYLITGDIPLMWMRDSAAQVQQYVSLLKSDPKIQIIIEGLIRRQIQWIKLDPYGSSFRLALNEPEPKVVLTEWDIRCGRTIHVSMHDYEVDSICYFLRISYNYWKEMNQCAIFEDKWLEAAKSIVKTWKLEQNHDRDSSYTYPILQGGGKGSRTCYTGMTWSGSRPSDDPCMYHYLVPSNMFAVVTLRHLQEILLECYPEEQAFLQEVRTLESGIEEGIAKHAVVEHEGKKIYAYEVDGCGSSLLMDDANVPSLLSMDYLGFTTKFDPDGTIKKNTYDFILSHGNPHYHSGPVISGIGSPHTPGNNVWPMAVIMEGLSRKDPKDINRIVNMLEGSDGGTNFMHESVNVGSGQSFTRSWFAWANSLFSELVIKNLDLIEAKP